jgi:hypothetical protein
MANTKSKSDKDSSGKKSSRSTVYQTGRYTPKNPQSKKHSPRWYGPVCLAIIVISLLAIIVNYTSSILPGSPSNWYLIGGVIGMAAGLMALMNYK